MCCVINPTVVVSVLNIYRYVIIHRETQENDYQSTDIVVDMRSTPEIIYNI